jgi:hypothetical protein
VTFAVLAFLLVLGISYKLIIGITPFWLDIVYILCVAVFLIYIRLDKSKSDIDNLSKDDERGNPR